MNSKELYTKYKYDVVRMLASLEGLKISKELVYDICNNKIAEFNTEEELTVRNINEAYDFLVDNAEDYRISFTVIRELNKIVCKDLADTNGEVRDIPVKISGTSYIPEPLNDSIVSADLSELISNKTGLELGLSLAEYISRSQVFKDGNKRTSLLSLLWTMYKSNEGIVLFTDIAEYQRCLLYWYETKSDNFRNFLIQNILKE